MQIRPLVAENDRLKIVVRVLYSVRENIIR